MSERTKLLTVKISPEEKHDWMERALANGLTLSDFIRVLVGAAQVGRAPKKHGRMKRFEADPDLLRELNRVGNNLNQIARWCNIHKSTADLESVLIILIQAERELNELKTVFGTYAY